MTTIGDIGEFAFIDRIRRFAQERNDVLVGIGDDAAVVRCGGEMVVVTSDMAIEGVHFLLDRAAPKDIGWKVAAAGVSDIAAMGAAPKYIVLSIAAPPDCSLSTLDDVYAGIEELARGFETVIIGGDTTRSPQGIVIDVITIGETIGGVYATRSGARSGDLLLVTGHPGRSAAGRHAQEYGQNASELIRAHYRPVPRVAEGQWLAQHGSVHAMIDVSDGLAQDAGHLAEAAGLGIDIDSSEIPLADDLKEYRAVRNRSPIDFALYGGEDYELAFAADPVEIDKLCNDFGTEFELPITVIGSFSDHFKGLRIDGDPLHKCGYEHFRAGSD